MDFGLVDMSLVCSSSATSAPNNGGGLFALDSANEADEANNGKQRFCGFGLLKQDRDVNVDEDDFRGFNKISKISSVPRDDCDLTNGHQQMLSFSSPTSQSMALPYGYGSSGILNMQQGVVVSGVRGPFTPSQWMELEHQALIYKYITASVPIPSYLLNPIHKAFESIRFLGYPSLRSGGLGWGGFHLGYGSTDPEPGRCRRTDGKKWRCSRDAVADQKYCERHINRGRHRSRKPVEGHSAPHSAPSGPTTALTGGKLAASSTGGLSTSAALSRQHQLGCNNNNHHLSEIPNINRYITDKQNADETLHKKVVPLEKDDLFSSVASAKQHLNEPEFGLVFSDSLLNPLDQSSSLINFKSYNNNHPPDKLAHQDINKAHLPLRQFMDGWPENQLDGTHLSISIDSPSRELEMGLGLGPAGLPAHQRQMGWVPISLEPAVGGPLGEVLHSREVAKPLPPLNLMGSWDGSSSSSPRTGVSSPTGVLQKASFGSMSNSSPGSSPRAGACSRLFGLGHTGSSMPTL